MTEIAHWEETNGSPEGPITAFSGSSVQRQEHRILGVMAVQGFSRIRAKIGG